MPNNPYDINTVRGKFTIIEQDHAFTLVLDKKSLECHLFRSEVSSWLFKNADGKWTLSNPISVENPKGRDFTVVIEDAMDIIAFRNHFIDCLGEREWPTRYDFETMRPIAH